MTERTSVETTAPAETPDDHGVTVTVVSHDDGLRVEAGEHYLTAMQARTLAGALLAAAEMLDEPS